MTPAAAKPSHAQAPHADPSRARPSPYDLLGAPDVGITEIYETRGDGWEDEPQVAAADEVLAGIPDRLQLHRWCADRACRRARRCCDPGRNCIDEFDIPAHVIAWFTTIHEELEFGASLEEALAKARPFANSVDAWCEAARAFAARRTSRPTGDAACARQRAARRRKRQARKARKGKSVREMRQAQPE